MRDRSWRSTIEWTMAGKALLLLVLTLLAGGAAVLGLSERVQQVQQHEHSVHAQLKSVEQRLHDARNNLEYIRTYYDKYDEFKNAGIIAEEDRLQWIDAVRAVADEIRLPKVDYYLNPRRQLLTGQTAEQQAKLWYSTMNLKLSLLHEGDLIVFINKLRGAARGVFDIDFCRLDRQAQEVTFTARAINVTAECDLQWFTIDNG